MAADEHGHIHICSSSLLKPPSIPPCVPIPSYRCPHKNHASWFWLAHSRGDRSQLAVVLISHNALQPMAPAAPAATTININEPSPDEYASNGNSGGVQVNKSSSPIRGGRWQATPRGGNPGRKWQLRTSKRWDFNRFVSPSSNLRQGLVLVDLNMFIYSCCKLCKV